MNKVNHQKQPLNAHPKATSPLSVSRPWIFRTLLNYCLGSYDVKNDYPKPSKALAHIFTYIMPGMLWMWVLLKTDCVLFFSSSYHLIWEKVEIKTHWVHCCLSFKTTCWAHVGRRTVFTRSRVHDGFIFAFACLLTAHRTVCYRN